MVKSTHLYYCFNCFNFYTVVASTFAAMALVGFDLRTYHVATPATPASRAITPPPMTRDVSNELSVDDAVAREVGGGVGEGPGTNTCGNVGGKVKKSKVGGRVVGGAKVGRDVGLTHTCGMTQVQNIPKSLLAHTIGRPLFPDKQQLHILPEQTRCVSPSQRPPPSVPLHAL